eukprot:103782_1
MAESSSSELYAPQQRIKTNNTQSPEGKQRAIAKSLEINIQKENGINDGKNVHVTFKEVNPKSPTTPTGHSYSAIPVYIAHPPRSSDHAAGSNVYCVVCYRIAIHLLLLYCVVGMTYLLVFQQKTSPFYTNTDDNAFTQITDTVQPTTAAVTNNPSTEPSAEPSVFPTMVPTFNLMNFHVGDYKMSAQNASHDNWLLCDGSEVLIANYPLLYDLISTAFGVSSNQSLFYKLPNATNKVIGVVSLKDAHCMGDVVGSDTGTITLSESQLPSHSHLLVNVEDEGHCDSARNGPDLYLASHCWNGDYTGGNAYSDYGLARTYAPPNALSSSSVGASDPINIMQPTMYAGNLFIYAQ